MRELPVPPPDRCEPLAGMVARFGGTMDYHSAAGTIDTPVPTHATDEVRAFWRAEAQAETAPTFTAHLPGGRVFGAGIVLAPDGRSLARDVSLDFGKTPEEHWLLTHGKIRAPQPVSGTSAVIASTLGMGYGHWLLDELPRLLTLPRSGVDNLIAHANSPINRTALTEWGWTGTLLPPDRGAHYQCEQLVIPSLVGTIHQPVRCALDLISAFTASFHADTSPFGERIYVTRERARRRTVVNESALWAELERTGFVKVRLEDLGWPEQINAFRYAKAVVAPHGAGLANLVFCSPGTRVVELFNRAYVEGCFWRLAALQGLDYRPIVSTGPEPLGRALTANRLDITADLGAVRAALR